MVQAALSLLEALVNVNIDIMQRQTVPNLYDTRVKYRQEPQRGKEMFDNCLQCLKRGWGDCDDMAAWRVAELRNSGETEARCKVVWPKGRRTYHAMVERADGTIEDPCQIMRRNEQTRVQAPVLSGPVLGLCKGAFPCL